MRLITKSLFLAGAALICTLAFMTVLSEESHGSFAVHPSYVGNTEIQLAWPAEGKDDFNRYEVYRDEELKSTIYTANESWYQDQTLTKYLSYNYRVDVYCWNHNHSEIILKESDETGGIDTGATYGDVICDTTWTAADGPYELSAAVRVIGNAKLYLGTGTIINASGTHVEGAHPEIDGITVYGGLTFTDQTSLSVKNSEFHYAIKDDTRYPGLEIFSCSGVVLEKNRFFGYEPGAWPHNAPAIRFDLQQESTPCSNVYIGENEFTDCYYGIFGWNLDNATIYRNEFTDTYFGIGIDDDLNNSEVYENTFKTIEWEQTYTNGIFATAHSSQIYENTFTGLGEGIFLFGEDSVCHNNTLTNLSTTAITVQGRNQQIIDNLIVGGSGDHTEGIELQGDRHTIARNNITKIGDNAFSTSGDITNTTISYNLISNGKHGLYTRYGHHAYNTVDHNVFNNNTGTAFTLEWFNNCTFDSNRIIDTSGGFLLNYACYDNTIKKNIINNTGEGYRGSGITMGGTRWVYNNTERNTIEENRISGKSYGVALYGMYDANYGTIKADNNTIRKNNLSGNQNGIYIQGGNNNTITGNTILDCDRHGISITYTHKWNVNHGGQFNTVEKNTISSAVGFEIMDVGVHKSNNKFKENTVGKHYPTTITVEDFDGELRIAGVKSPPAMPQPPHQPAKCLNISNFVKIRYFGSPYSLTFHYKDEHLRKVNEDNLDIWRWRDVVDPADQWSADNELTDWKTDLTISDPDSNEIDVLVKKSLVDSVIYAPLIPMPVHNIDSMKDFDTIQAAIDDSDTVDGHTITVDPAYTSANTWENLDINSKLTIISSSGGAAQNTIRPKNGEDDVIRIRESDVTIRGFTITGSDNKRGIYSNGDCENVIIEDCVFSGNFIGILYEGIADLEDHGTIEIKECTFDGNKNAGILMTTSFGCRVEKSTFSGGNYGVALQYSEKAMIRECTFEGQELVGIYVLEGSENSLFSNDLKKTTAGILIQTSNENDLSFNTIDETEIGIELRESSENVIEENTVKGVTEYGIKITEGSDENKLVNGSIEGTRNGILVEDSDGNQLAGFQVKLSGTNDLIGVDIKNSKGNTLQKVNITDLSTVGYAATGMRLYAGATNNVVTDSTVIDLGSGNSTGLVAGSSLNRFESLTVSGITSYGRLRSAGILVLPQANANEFAKCTVFDITAKYDAYGIFLAENTNNKFNHCIVKTVTTVEDDSNRGHGMHTDRDSEVKLNDCTFMNNEVGLFVVNGSSPTVHWSEITGNTHSGILSKVDALTLDAENNWWGDASGPSGVAAGSGDVVSLNVDYDPWIGATHSGFHAEEVSTGEGTVDATAEADIAVEYDITGDVTITAMKYDGNPGGNFDGAVGKYIDVHLDRSAGVNEIVIKLFYTTEDLGGQKESGLRMMWWDGTQWTQCSDTGVDTTDANGYAGHIWAKVRADTTPSLADMTGTPFGAVQTGSGGTADDDDDDDDSGGGAALWIMLIIVVCIVLGIVLMKMGILPPGGETQEGTDEWDSQNKGDENKPDEMETQRKMDAGSEPMKMTKADIIDPKTDEGTHPMQMTKADLINPVSGGDDDKEKKEKKDDADKNMKMDEGTQPMQMTKADIINTGPCGDDESEEKGSDGKETVEKDNDKKEKQDAE